MITRTTAKSVMPSNTLPSNPSRWDTDISRPYRPYWREEIAELVTKKPSRGQRERGGGDREGEKVERDPTMDYGANYNKVATQVKLLTKHCKADKWKRVCKDIDLRKESRKA